MISAMELGLFHLSRVKIARLGVSRRPTAQSTGARVWTERRAPLLWQIPELSTSESGKRLRRVRGARAPPHTEPPRPARAPLAMVGSKRRTDVAGRQPRRSPQKADLPPVGGRASRSIHCEAGWQHLLRVSSARERWE